MPRKMSDLAVSQKNIKFLIKSCRDTVKSFLLFFFLRGFVNFEKKYFFKDAHRFFFLNRMNVSSFVGKCKIIDMLEEHFAGTKF